MSKLSSHLNFNVNSAWQAQGLKTFNGLEGGFTEVDEAAVRAHLELVARVLVLEGRAVDREFSDLGRQGSRAVDDRPAAFRGIDDLSRGFIEDDMVKRAQADSDGRNFLFVFLALLCAR